MEPHTSSYLSKYLVKLFRLHTHGVPITSLVLNLAWCMLECSTSKVCCGAKTLSHPWHPRKLAWSRSPCTRKSWRVSVLVSRVVSIKLTFPVLYVSCEVQFSARKPIVTIKWWGTLIVSLWKCNHNLFIAAKNSKPLFQINDYRNNWNSW